MPLINLTDGQVCVAGLDHPEGVAWGPEGKLYAGGEAGQLYRPLKTPQPPHCGF